MSIKRFSYMPQTFTFVEENFQSEMEALNDKINEIEDSDFLLNTQQGQIIDLRTKCSPEKTCGKKLTVPWILKPGEFTNRGIGISMGFTKKEIFQRINDEFNPVKPIEHNVGNSAQGLYEAKTDNGLEEKVSKRA